MKNDEYLILGNSTAAVAAIEAIRVVDRATPITLVSRESWHTYSRPLISYLLAGELDEQRMYYRAPDFYRTHKVTPHLGVTATRIDPENRVVMTDRDQALPFARLLIATGGKPIRPPLEGTDAQGVFTFVSWDDIRAIDTWIGACSAGAAPPRVVIVGAGLIGLKALEAFRARALETVVVEREDRVLPQSLDKQGSELVEQAIENAGAEILCSTCVDRILKDDTGRVAGVALETGRTIPCELVILATGVAPDTTLVQGTSIKTDRGILIDRRCMTSVDGLYAAGDVVQGMDTLSGASRPLPLFPNAFRQGRVAGTNMAGGQAALGGCFPMNAVEVFGLPVISVGLSTASGNGFTVLDRRGPAGPSYRRVVLRDNRVVGAVFIGDIERAGILTGLMRGRVDVSGIAETLLTDDFGILSLPADYRKHVVQGEGIEV